MNNTGILRTSISPKLLRGGLVLILLFLVAGAFFPAEEVFIWHMMHNQKPWICNNFRVVPAAAWIADSGSSCTTGIHLVQPRPTLISSLEERGSVTFSEQEQIGDQRSIAKFEQTFRLVAKKMPQEPLTYTDQYQPVLGRCMTASLRDRNVIIVWCRNPQNLLVTRYSGEEKLLPEVLEMLGRR
ncbi:hypothetical protein SAMN05421771_4108 [Granulicella pectinivorans]|uniref:Uncharacterized protein n=1 Tax=Granulicella pectinivorans TaxID=474950 RepID=A0A1I6N0D4_9BACT|nr:hypothetical protein [Granulicella pectinivorans]SFS21248.1 hypothetical protein SAMN05421771_4108 [Granulicella pectinivorans]